MKPAVPSAHRLFRSVLYVPAANRRALEKARGLPVDALILDLEDAVAPERKAEAREAAIEALRADGYGARFVIIRVNGGDTPWGADDLAACAEMRPDAVLLAKVEGPEDVDAAAASLPDGTAIWTMIETPTAVLRAERIAAAPRMGGLVLGTNDLAHALGSADVPGRAPLLHALHSCLLAARAAGVVCIDGVHNALDDPDGFAAECAQGRMLGMDGKSLIHPDQIAAANAAFAPTREEIDLARRRIAVLDAALAEGRGVAVLDGRIVEGLHVDNARRTLARWSAIAAMEGTE